MWSTQSHEHKAVEIGKCVEGSCGKFSNVRSRALSGTNTAAPTKDRNLFTRKKWKSRDFPIKGKMPRDSAFPDCFKRQACTELSQSSSISLKFNRGRFSSWRRYCRPGSWANLSNFNEFWWLFKTLATPLESLFTSPSDTWDNKWC